MKQGINCLAAICLVLLSASALAGFDAPSAGKACSADKPNNNTPLTPSAARTCCESFAGDIAASKQKAYISTCLKTALDIDQQNMATGSTQAPANSYSSSSYNNGGAAPQPWNNNTVTTAPDGCSGECGRIVRAEVYQTEGQGSGAGMVVGGLAGALLGNQIGKGSGRTLATIGGAAGGAYVGNQVEKNSNSNTRMRLEVQMDQGGIRNFEVPNDGQFRYGDRVKINNGVLQRF